MILVDQESEANLGGQAFWSFGGLFLVDSPEQRRLGIRDSLELAWQDWLGTAGFDRDRGPLAPPVGPRPTSSSPRARSGPGCTTSASGSSRWSAGPSAAAACADGRGNSVPRFHIVWGTGPGIVEPFERRVARARRAPGGCGSRSGTGWTRCDERRRRGRRPGGPAGPGRRRRAARPPTATWSASSRSRAQAVVVTCGGIGGNHELVRRELAGAARQPPPAAADRRSRARRRPDARRSPGRPGASWSTRDRMWHYTEGVANHARSGRATASGSCPGRRRCGWTRRAAAARAAVPGLRHARHARPHRARPGTSTPGSSRPEDRREGVRPVGLGAEPRPDRQATCGRCSAGPAPGAPGAGARPSSTAARTSSSRDTLPSWCRHERAHRPHAPLDLAEIERHGRRPRPRDRQPVHQGPADHRPARRPALPRRQADPGRARRTGCSTRRPGRWSPSGCGCSPARPWAGSRPTSSARVLRAGGEVLPGPVRRRRGRRLRRRRDARLPRRSRARSSAAACSPGGPRAAPRPPRRPDPPAPRRSRTPSDDQGKLSGSRNSWGSRKSWGQVKSRNITLP